MTMAALYTTKKALKQSIGEPLRHRETSMHGAEFQENGSFCVVGPDEYKRKWSAQVTMKDGLIAKVS